MQQRRREHEFETLAMEKKKKKIVLWHWVGSDPIQVDVIEILVSTRTQPIY